MSDANDRNMEGRNTGPTIEHDSRPKALKWGGRMALSSLVGVGMLAVGLVVGAGAMVLATPRDAVTLLNPTPISQLKDADMVAVKRTVAEIYGNKFIVQDQSGRTLVETGRRGEGGGLVIKDETITVQGRFDDGFMKGDTLVHADGRAQSLKPPKPGPAGWMADHLKGGRVDVQPRRLRRLRRRHRRHDASASRLRPTTTGRYLALSFFARGGCLPLDLISMLIIYAAYGFRRHR